MTIHASNTVESLGQRIAATRKRLCDLSSNVKGDTHVPNTDSKTELAFDSTAQYVTPLGQRIAATRKRLYTLYLGDAAYN